MKVKVKKISSEGNFHLSKWFLDFVGENGEAMIFYAAKLKWNDWSVGYTSWLDYHPKSGINLKTRYSKVQIPQVKDHLITWCDSKFGISGTWEALSDKIQARIFDSEEGFLDWECFQPASNVELKINDSVLKGKGYAERLTLTVLPWKIPMDELRWGRFGSEKNILVWIELLEKSKQQWLWLNGEQIGNCIIDDACISIPDKELVLNLDRGVSLESEKKIYALMQKIIRYIPGFNKFMPVNFLMAEECKWLGKGQLQDHGRVIDNGMAIHEWVNFNA
jgi:hypothetical protein